MSLSFGASLRRALVVLGIAPRREGERRPEAVHQVAALPVKVAASGKLKVLLISTRGHRGRLIVPRGWPMRGKADFQAARIEAEEEAGVSGPISLHPLGSYDYHSGRKAGGAPIRVDVYRLDVTREAPKFKEKGQRRRVWLDVVEASARVAEPGLVPIIEGLDPSRKVSNGTPAETVGASDQSSRDPR